MRFDELFAVYDWTIAAALLVAWLCAFSAVAIAAGWIGPRTRQICSLHPGTSTCVHRQKKRGG